MAVTSGFFPYYKNNVDRKYDAEQIGKLLRGPLKNGVIGSIGDGFCCRKIDIDTISIGSGVGCLNGFYILNDQAYNYTIPTEAYPEVPISRIQIEQPPQLDYPAGNPLDLGDLIVGGYNGSYELLGIELTNPPQTDYPSGNPLDLGDLRVDAIYQEGPSVITGNCYIVIELDEISRSMDIRAVSIEEYNQNIQLIIAICSRSEDGLSVYNMVGYSIDNVMGAPLLTGLLRSDYINGAFDDLGEIYEAFESMWEEKYESKYEDWYSDIVYDLDTTEQYSRMTARLNTKATKPRRVSYHVSKGDTFANISVGSTPTNVAINVRMYPLDLALMSIVLESGILYLEFQKAKEAYDLVIELMEV